MEILQFALLLIVAQFIPGPDFALVTRSTLVYGFKYGVMCGVGIASALVIHSCVVCFGGAYILAQNPMVTQSILLLAAIWLLRLAYMMWPKKQKDLSADMDDGSLLSLPSAKSLFSKAFITCLLNPKCIMFLAALATPLLAPGHASWVPIAIIAIAVGQGLILWIFYAYLLRLLPIEKYLLRILPVLDRVFSLGLVYFSLVIIINIVREFCVSA